MIDLQWSFIGTSIFIYMYVNRACVILHVWCCLQYGYSLCTIKQYLKYLKFIPPRIAREDCHPEGITPQQKYFLLFSSLSRKVYNMLFNQMDFLVSVFNLPMLSVILLSKCTKFERHLNLLFKTDKALNKRTELFWHHSK